jgi:HlyD family secretion protein
VLFDEETDEGDEGEEEQTYVFVMKDGKAVRRDVEVGISSDSDQEITDGLEEGELVISGPYRILRHLMDGEDVERAEDDEDDDGATEENSD